MTKFINSSGPLHLNIYIEQVSQDIANNSSRVSWRATIDRDGAYRTWTYGNISNLSVWLMVQVFTVVTPITTLQGKK